MAWELDQVLIAATNSQGYQFLYQIQMYGCCWSLDDQFVNKIKSHTQRHTEYHPYIIG